MMLRGRKFSFLLDATLIAIFIAVFEWLMGAWKGYPVGWDAYNALTRLRFVLDNFPHINWGPIWSGGMPLFIWYQPLPYLILTAVVKITNWTPEFTLNVATITVVILVGISLYLLTMEMTNNRLISIVVVLIAMTTPAFLSWHFFYGLYSRIFATPFLGFSILAALIYSKRSVAKEDTKAPFIFLVVSLSLAVQSHTLVGAIAGVSVVFVLLLNIDGVKEKMKTILKISATTLGLSAYFVIPFIVYRAYSTFSTIVSRVDLPYEVSALVSPSTKGVSESLSPFLIPFFILLFIAFLLKHRRGRTVPRDFLSLSIIACVLIMYSAFVLWGVPVKVFWPPGGLTYFVPLVLSPVIGILLHSALSRLQRGNVVVIIITFVLFVWISYQYPLSPNLTAVVHGPNYGEVLTSNMLINVNISDWNYRFGSNQAGFAVWFNYKYPMIPQTKDYFAQGDVNSHFNYFYETTTLRSAGNVEQTKFLLDWWGVKWLIVDSRFDQTDKFLESSQNFKLLGIDEGKNLFGFKYNDASPILSASNTPVALFIGSDETYSLVFKSLALSNFNSKSLILVNGGKYIDDSRSALSEDYDLIILYGYDYHFQEEAYPLLRDYVADGGRLLLLTDLSSDSSRRFIPEPAPIWSTNEMAFGTEWAFTYTPNEYTDDVNFTRFSPAVYADGPWGYSGTTITDLRDGVEVILSNHGQPVVVQRDYGRGRVIWCGLNLPLHIVSYENQEESCFFINLIKGGLLDGEGDKPEYAVSQINPEQFEVILRSPAKGVLFKECYFPNWRAYLIGRNRKKIEIYRAGPNFMYVKMPDQEVPLKVQFRYEKSIAQWLGDSISISSICVLLLYASPISRVRARVRYISAAVM